MTPTDIHYLDAHPLAEKIRQREISSVEVTKMMLSRIEKLDTQLHSYAYVMHEQALAQAEWADRQTMKGEMTGPLHGVPIAVKDLYWVKGAPTAAGTTVYRDFIPNADATAVRKLREAGAIILGKLQLTEGAFATHHPTIIPPVNPWNADCWPGASSSGSGVATAAGLCYASLGTDTGGSIRFPCAANGLTGIKPTWGRVSRYGVFELGASLDHAGPMARSAVDAALMLSIIAGYDSNDPTSRAEEKWPMPDAPESLRGLTIGIDYDWCIHGADAATVEAINRTLTTLKELGAIFREVRFPDARHVVDEWEINCGVEVAVAHESTYPQFAEQYGPALTRLIETGRATTSLRYQQVLLHRAAFRGQVNKLMSEIDVLLAPVQPFAAPTHQKLSELAQDPELNARLIQFTAPFNSTGHPSITLPCGLTENGMPIGFQLIAAHGAEAILCRSGIVWQQATDWHRARPIR